MEAWLIYRRRLLCRAWKATKSGPFFENTSACFNVYPPRKDSELEAGVGTTGQKGVMHAEGEIAGWS